HVPQNERQIYAALRRGVSVPIQQSFQFRYFRNGDQRMLRMRTWLFVFAISLAFVGWVISTAPDFKECADSQYQSKNQESTKNPPPLALAASDLTAIYVRCA